MATRPSIALIVLLAAACSSVERDEAGYEIGAARWWKGDVHVHATGASNDTGGDSFPSDIKAMAIERGLDFVVLTDHSNSTGSDPTTRDEDPALFNQGPEFVYVDESLGLSDDTFLMRSGNEISPRDEGEIPGPVGHVGCVPGTDDLDRATPFIDRPMGSVSGSDAVEQARARGCFSIVNHPFEHAPWIRYDWSSPDYDALEVWNGGAGFDERDLEAYAAWQCDLFNGMQVTPIGASDNHRVHRPPPGELLHPALGYPNTAVFAESLTWPAIVAGLRAGHVAIQEGGTALYLETFDDDLLRAEASDVRVVRLHGALDTNVEQAVLAFVRVTGCDDRRHRLDPPVAETVPVFQRGVRSGGTFDEQIMLAEPGVYTATLLSGDNHYQALSRAVIID